MALFVGALGDQRKGFDTLFHAWVRLCAQKAWDVDLCVAGTGAQRESWEREARLRGLGERVRFLGFRKDMPRLLSAADLLVAPTRYEPYGLGVHEALCVGIPALVSRSAGVAERYPAELQGLLLDSPDDSGELMRRLEDWRSHGEVLAPAVAAVLEAAIVICFTGQSRSSDAIIRDQVSAITTVDKLDALEAMHQLKTDAIAMKLALLHSDIAQMARILDRSWAAKKSTAHSVSTPVIDHLWSVAHANGALAGKISGAGGGGFMMFMVDPDERARVIRALNHAGGTASGINLTEKGVESWPY